MSPLLQAVVGMATLLGLLTATAASSDDVVPEGYRVVAAQYGIPPTVLYAVAMTESGVGANVRGAYRPWPWTLNVAGHGRVYPSRAAAWSALNRFLARGERFVDIGIMQVNWRYHRDKLGDPWLALEPYHNLRVAAGILRECYTKRRDWWASVGCYHSPNNSTRAQRYRQRVVGYWQRLATSG